MQHVISPSGTNVSFASQLGCQPGAAPGPSGHGRRVPRPFVQRNQQPMTVGSIMKITLATGLRRRGALRSRKRVPFFNGNVQNTSRGVTWIRHF